MARNFGLREALLLFAAVVILATAYLLDNWLYRLQLVGASSFNVAPAIWAGTLANVFLAGVLLLLGWYVLREPKNLFVALFFVVVGAVQAFNPIIFFYGFSYLPLQTSATLGPKSLYVMAGAFLMVIGLLMFILNRQD